MPTSALCCDVSGEPSWPSGVVTGSSGGGSVVVVCDGDASLGADFDRRFGSSPGFVASVPVSFVQALNTALGSHSLCRWSGWVGLATTSGASAGVSERVKVLYVRYAAGLRPTRIGGKSVVISAALVAVSACDSVSVRGTVFSVQSVLVKFPEVVVVHDAETITSTVVQVLDGTVRQEVRGTWLNCCCTSGRLSR
jgi:hypothetical protein